MDSGKSKDVMDVVAKEEVSMVEEDVMAIQITPTTPGMVLTSEILIGISSVPIWIAFMGKVNYMLAVNRSMERMVVDAVRTEHAGGVAVAEDNIFQNLILIGLTLAMEYVATDDTVHRMAPVLY